MPHATVWPAFQLYILMETDQSPKVESRDSTGMMFNLRSP